MGDSRSGYGRSLYVMPDSFRGQLATPVGLLATSREDILIGITGSEILVTVGDIVTLDILESGIVPDISIIDYMTKREPESALRERFSRFQQREVLVRNPPGHISAELWDAIADAYRSPGHVRIVVDGEEDLAALACISLAPDNTTVIYGIPNRGASIHRVDDNLKRLVNDTLEKMKA